MDKNWLIKFNFSLNFMVAPKFQVKVKNFDINGSNEFLSTKMSKSLKHYSFWDNYHAQKSCKKLFYLFFINISSFEPRMRNFNYFYITETIILVRNINCSTTHSVNCHNFTWFPSVEILWKWKVYCSKLCGNCAFLHQEIIRNCGISCSEKTSKM